MKFKRLSIEDLPQKGLEIFEELPKNLNEIVRTHIAYKFGVLFRDFEEIYKNIVNKPNYIKMINGHELERDNEIGLLAVKCGRIQTELNKESSRDIQKVILRKLIGKMGNGTTIITPFMCDFGVNIEIGEDTFINKNCNFLDDGKISIGNRCMLGPGVTIAAVNHFLDPNKRFSSKCPPVIIGDNVWIGMGAIINPGVKIGENSVVASGSVVNKDVPPNVLVAGNPAVIKKRIAECEKTN